MQMFMGTLGQMALAAAVVSSIAAPTGASSLSVFGNVGRLEFENTALSATLDSDQWKTTSERCQTYPSAMSSKSWPVDFFPCTTLTYEIEPGNSLIHHPNPQAYPHPKGRLSIEQMHIHMADGESQQIRLNHKQNGRNRGGQSSSRCGWR